jgi:hypothetical protein
MWMCRYCAAHVKDDVLTCLCCGTSAPARLLPELAEKVTEHTHTTYQPPEPSIPIKLGFPTLEKQSSKRALEIGALIGFLLVFSLSAFTIIQGVSSRRNFGSLVIDVIGSLFLSVICGGLGGLIGASLSLFLLPLVDLFFRLIGRADPSSVLPPHSALAKTETLGTRNHGQELLSESSEITDLQQPNRSSITDMTSGIHAQNQDLSSE